MRKLFHQYLRESPVGQLQRAGASLDDVLEQVKKDRRIGETVMSVLYDFPFMSYYYSGMYVVIEAWKKRKLYQDATIDSLLTSPRVASLEQYRHASFHFTPRYHDERFRRFLEDLESDVWLSDVRDAFAAWFRYHLKLTPEDDPLLD